MNEDMSYTVTPTCMSSGHVASAAAVAAAVASGAASDAASDAGAADSRPAESPALQAAKPSTITAEAATMPACFFIRITVTPSRWWG